MNKSMPEIVCLADIKPSRPGTSFGLWKYRKSNLTLWCQKYQYEIDLEKITDSAKMLDWIFQVNSKTWAQDDPAVMSDLINALDDLLEPQANYCSWAKDKSANPKSILKRQFAKD